MGKQTIVWTCNLACDHHSSFSLGDPKIGKRDVLLSEGQYSQAIKLYLDYDQVRLATMVVMESHYGRLYASILVLSDHHGRPYCNPCFAMSQNTKFTKIWLEYRGPFERFETYSESVQSDLNKRSHVVDHQKKAPLYSVGWGGHTTGSSGQISTDDVASIFSPFQVNETREGHAYFDQMVRYGFLSRVSKCFQITMSTGR